MAREDEADPDIAPDFAYGAEEGGHGGVRLALVPLTRI
jgi:hypothetical protein